MTSVRTSTSAAVDAFENNAQMAVLSRSTAEAGVPTLQTSVWDARTSTSAGSTMSTRPLDFAAANASACR
jgi:hypothetical protein